MLRVCVVSYTVAPAAAVAMRGTPVAAEKEELEPVDRARMGPFDVDRLLRQPVPGACAANGALHDSDLKQSYGFKWSSADDGKGNALYRKIVKSPCNIFLQRMLVAKIAGEFLRFQRMPPFDGNHI